MEAKIVIPTVPPSALVDARIVPAVPLFVCVSVDISSVMIYRIYKRLT